MVGFFRNHNGNGVKVLVGLLLSLYQELWQGVFFTMRLVVKKIDEVLCILQLCQELSEWYCLHKPHLAFPSITKVMGDARETQYVCWNDIAGCQEDWDTSTGIGFKRNIYPEKSEYTSLCRIKWLVKWLVCYSLVSVWVSQLVLTASPLQMTAWLDCSIRTATSSVGKEGEHWSWSPHGIHPHSS